MTDPHQTETTPSGPTAEAAVASAASRSTAAGGPPMRSTAQWRAPAWRSKDVLRTAALVMAMYMLVRLVWFAHPLLLTAFLGVLFGLAVSSGVDRLTRVGVRRGAAAGLIVVGFFSLLVAFAAWVAPTLRVQGAELRHQLPEALDRLELWVDQRRGGIIGLLLGGLATEVRSDSAAAARPARPAAKALPSARDSLPPHATLAADSGRAPVRLRDRIGQQLSGATRYLFPFLSSTLAAVAGLLVIVFMSIYIAADPELYRSGIMHLFPHHARERAGEVLTAMASVLRKWLVTQLIAMATIGGVTTIVLLILRVKAALALGVLAGLLEFIPTIGPILSAMPGIAMGFLDSPEKALYVLIAYTGVQFLENHLLIPLLMKGGVNLPPALTILSQALMALLFGFLGLMCAVPILAATMVAVKMLYVEGVVGDPPFAPDENPEEGVRG